MPPLQLAWEPHDPAVAQILRTVIAAFAECFGGRVQAAYLVGSYVEGSAVPLSDLDCCVVFAGDWTDPAEQAAAEALAEQLADASAIRLDLLARPAATLTTLHPVFQVALKLGSALLCGTDLRDKIPLPPLERYAADVAIGARFFVGRLRGLDALPATVDYPDAADPFFGYTSKRIAAWYPPTVPAGTKELVATVSRIATARLAAETGSYIPGKGAAIAQYQARIADRWAPFVEQIFRRCKQDWQYLVPEGAAERAELRTLCRTMLAFENDFLGRYPA